MHWDTVTTFFPPILDGDIKVGCPPISLGSIFYFSLKLEGVSDNHKTVNLVLGKSCTTALCDKIRYLYTRVKRKFSTYIQSIPNKNATAQNDL